MLGVRLGSFGSRAKAQGPSKFTKTVCVICAVALAWRYVVTARKTPATASRASEARSKFLIFVLQERARRSTRRAFEPVVQLLTMIGALQPPAGAPAWAVLATVVIRARKTPASRSKFFIVYLLGAELYHKTNEAENGLFISA